MCPERVKFDISGLAALVLLVGSTSGGYFSPFSSDWGSSSAPCPSLLLSTGSESRSAGSGSEPLMRLFTGHVDPRGCHWEGERLRYLDIWCANRRPMQAPAPRTTPDGRKKLLLAPPCTQLAVEEETPVRPVSRFTFCRVQKYNPLADTFSKL